MQTATVAAIRFGYGLRLQPQPGSAETVWASLQGPDTARATYPTPDRETARQTLARIRELRKAKRGKDADVVEQIDGLRKSVRRTPVAVCRAQLARICDAPSPFLERLTRFWMDHFTVATRNETVNAMAGSYVDGAIRTHVTGRFSDLLRAVVEHPAMLAYLDQVGSVGPNSRVGQRRNRGLNENLAREVLELHTLGVGGGYSQNDVREFAELLTGLTFSPMDGTHYRRIWAEPGPEDILGRSYGARGGERLAHIHAFLDDLARHPDTARHLSRKLAVHFVSDTPPQPLVDHIAAAWSASDGDLMTVYRALLEHPAAWTPKLKKAKPPFDFVASSLVALGISGADVWAWNDKRLARIARRPMRLMGQPFMRPDGPDGWSEAAEAWITPLGLAQRITWGQRMPRKLLQNALPDPRGFVETVLADAAGPRLRWAVSACETVPQGIALILASPEFNRR